MSLLSPRICKPSAVLINSFRLSFVMCTSPKYMYSRMALRISYLTSFIKNTGCVHGLFYIYAMDNVYMRKTFYIFIFYINHNNNREKKREKNREKKRFI